jgi:hypothetical protein
VRVYLAGPISLGGKLSKEETLYNLNAFHFAAERLRDMGYVVENPAENEDTDPPMDWSGWMRLGLQQLLTCDMIALLPGWVESRGAMVEVTLARELGIEIVEYRTIGLEPAGVSV